MSLKQRILCILIIGIIGAQAFPQQRQRQQRQRDGESPVIFIDFNFDGKVGEKAHRSLDQVQYRDGVRGRSSFTDSYGNPVSYDSLDDVDAQKPSKNRDNPFQYVIPGYASGILQPHEVPTRNAGAGEEGRRIDDRIHFVDPLNTNSFQAFDKKPATPAITLAAPGSEQSAAAGDSQAPIDIPKPNIHLSETPETPTIDDPIDHVPPHPPQDVFLNANTPPSTALQLPIHQESNTSPLAQNLIPPSIPSSAQGEIEIPRPNLDAPETPIDNDGGSPLNQGLLPPNSDFGSSTFNSPNANDRPVIITDDQIKFAPKPVNGLLPPKEPTPNDIDFQSAPSATPTPAPSMVASNSEVPAFQGSLTDDQTTRKQYTPFPSQPTQSPPTFQIPVQVIQSPPNGPNFIQPPKASTGGSDKGNKYQGTFGGAPGILSSDSQFDRVVPTQAASLPLAPSTTDKFLGGFGGPAGVLSNGNSANNLLPAASTTTQTFAQTAPVVGKEQSEEKTINKYTGRFGGPAGVLTPTA